MTQREYSWVNSLMERHTNTLNVYWFRLNLSAPGETGVLRLSLNYYNLTVDKVVSD